MIDVSGSRPTCAAGNAARHAAAALVLGVLLAGCGGRDAELDEPFEHTEAVGLQRAIAVGDEALQRVVLLTSASPTELSATSLPVGENRVSMVPTVDNLGLLVLSAGVRARRNADDELPSLSLIDASATPEVRARYTLPEAYSTLTLDPTGRWVVLSGTDVNFVTNPNQLVFVDLRQPDFQPVSKTIRSFGAAPERFQFTEPLDVPGGPRRFLIVESRQDVTLVDLDALAEAEITVPLPRMPNGQTGVPRDVVVYPGAPEIEADAQLAIRMQDDPNVVLVNFTASDESQAGFRVIPNLVDVGGAPAALDYVSTDGGLRLAALVPGRGEASLVHPTTTQIERVSLPVGFDSLRRVTESALGADESGDVALLWSNSASMVAFWSLGRTDGRVFRSLDVLELETNVSQVLDVPGASLGYKKLLASPEQRFFVLDLRERQSFPMFATTPNLSLRVAPDGLRAWAFTPNGNQLAKVDLTSLEPTSLQLERSISQVFDMETQGGAGRVLVALHPGDARGATLLDAQLPDTAETLFFPGLLLR
jgi:hypothetical protein